MHRKHTTAEDGMQGGRSVSHSGKTLRWYSFRPVAVLAAAAAALLTTGLVAGPLAGVSGAATPHATSHALATTGLGYTPLNSPVRIVDTRAGATDPATDAGKTLAEGANLTVDIPASAAIPANASAVVVNVTAIDPTNGGFLTVFPAGGTLPLAANVTFTNGQTVGDEVTVGLGADAASGSAQAFTVHNGPATGGASVDFTADVMGYYAPQTATSGDAFVGMTPARIFDSRTGSGQTGAGTTLTNGGSANVTVTGVGGVPASATAVVLNVAITNPTASSFIAAFPAGTTQPGTANQNFLAGETLSSQVIAKVGAGGAVTIANHAGNVDIVVDVDGYFTAAGGTGSLLNVIAPVRLQDTRPAGVAGGSSTTAVVQGAGATGAVLSVADITTVGDGNFLTAYPTGVTPPLAATVNYTPGDTYNVVENASYEATGTGSSVSVLNGPSNAATANVVVDEDGFFSPSTALTASSVNIGVPSTTVNTISVPANGSTRTVTATVTDGAGGATVAGDTVLFTVTPSTAGETCGTLASNTEVTGATGVTPADIFTAPATFTSGVTAPSCTVTAKDADFGQTGSAVIDQTQPANTVAITPANSAVPANGAANETLTATVTASSVGSGNNDTVTFTTLGTCGTLSPTSGNTGPGNAAVTTTYTASSSSGFCQITATEGNTGGSGTAAVDQTASPTPATGTVTITGATQVTAPVSGTPGPAVSGAYTATQTQGATAPYGLVVRDAGGATIANDEVAFTVTPTTGCGTVTPIVTATSGAGAASFSYTAASGSTAIGTCAVTAAEADTGANSTILVTQSPPAMVTTVTPASSNVPVGTNTAIAISVSNVTTADNGAPVTLAVTGGAGCGSDTPATTTLAVATGATTGTASSVYTAGGTPGFCTVTVTVGAPVVSAPGTTTIDQIA